MSTVSASDSVREQLIHARFTTASMAYIILDEDLDKILDKECLKQIIQRYKLKHMLAGHVINKIAAKMKWKKILALLLYIGAGNRIEAFIENNFRIPVQSVKDKCLLELIPSEEKRTQFYTDQRIFLSPVFKHHSYAKLATWSHLPFLEEKDFKSQGANSKIFEVTIPVSNLSPQPETLNGNKFEGYFTNEKNPRTDRIIVRYNIIRKEIEDDEFAEHELRIHKELNHQCIIPLYASYRFKSKLNLLLPKRGKSLKPFFEGNTTQWTETEYLSAIHIISQRKTRAGL